MSQKIIIREAENKDRNAIADLLLDAYHQYSEIMPEPLWLEYRKSLLDSVHGDTPLVRIIAEIDKKIVGSALLFSSSETAYGNRSSGFTPYPTSASRISIRSWSWRCNSSDSRCCTEITTVGCHHLEPTHLGNDVFSHQTVPALRL